MSKASRKYGQEPQHQYVFAARLDVPNAAAVSIHEVSIQRGIIAAFRLVDADEQVWLLDELKKINEGVLRDARTPAEPWWEQTT